jgi:lysylphosphatidylglycerol synthetase-like protein (DUF2156 family)
MLFLIAVLAFTSKSLFESSIVGVRVLFGLSLVLAFASFLAGYRTLFHLYDQEQKHPADDDGAAPTPSSISRAQIQYALTGCALFFLIVAVLWMLWQGKPGAN